MKNAYPEKPIVPFQRTIVEMGAVINYMKSLAINPQIKIMAYIMFRNESGNGKSGVNNNYAGLQADVGRWPEKYDNLITGVLEKKENDQGDIKGRVRYFCAFKSFETCVDMLIDRLQGRGLFIGGQTNFKTHMVIINAEDLCRAYYKEWVTGEKEYEPNDKKKSDFFSMYKQGVKAFLPEQ